MKIHTTKLMTALAISIFSLASFHAWAEGKSVEIKKADGDQYDVLIGGELFTSYLYDGEKFLNKPVFYPVNSPKGTPVNRSFPIGPKVEGEATDHPHQQSFWFTYGAVNGVDYWNLQRNSRRIANREVSADGNKLTAVLDWIDPDGVKVLEEKKEVTFGGGDDTRWMDHTMTLRANEADVVLGDSKEGAFGIRMAATLEEKRGTAKYINAQGLETSRGVWGKPSEWVAIRGIVKGKDGDEDVTLAIYAHPDAFGHPPRWHARDYGLFTVNPFAAKGYDSKLEAMSTELKKGDSLQVRYRFVVYDGKVDKARLDNDYAEFAKSE